MKKKHILVVEDEHIVAEHIKMSLLRLGYSVPGIVHSGEDAIQKAEEKRIDLVLMDIVLKGEMDGIEAASTISSRFNIPVVYLTAYTDEKTLERAKITEPFGYIIKPFEDKDLHTAIETALYRHKVGKRLKESEEKYRSLVENAYDAIYIISPERFKYVNPAFEKLTGWRKKELISKKFKFWDLIHPDDRESVKTRESARKVKVEIPNRYEFRVTTKEGRTKTVEAATVEISTTGELTVMGILRDITERKNVEKEIQNYQEKLRLLASKLSLTEEKERRKLATFMHDNIGQKLALIKMKLGALNQSLSEQERVNSTQLKTMNEIRDLLEETIQDTRVVTFELSPPILYELGLEQSLEWLVEQFREKCDLQFHFTVYGESKPVDDDIRTVLFHAVKELLMNVLKHASAKVAKVSVGRYKNKIKLTVEDDGRGFDSAKLSSHSIERGGFGFFNIRERLENLEGSLSITSQKGHGTQVVLLVPPSLKKEMSK